MNTKNILPVQNCTGCEACLNACPNGAITMEIDKDGFLYPLINKNKCSNCKMCLKSCPILNKNNKNKKNDLKTYAGFADEKERLKSSSGGIFSVIAKYILSKGGYISGAAFNKEWDVEHIIINNLKDLEKLRGSKYVQSNTNNCYKKIEKLLNEDKLVLFCGCPCQVAGLYSYLKKDYKKLYTIDLFCHGITPNSEWQKYLKENFNKNDILNINFRDKEKTGWSCSKCTITLKNEEIVTDDFTKLFHDSIILRSSCYDCDFSKLPRKADISLGDFWGVEKYFPNLDYKNGVSLIFLNNKKGEELINELDFSKGKLIPVKLKNDYNNGFIKKGLPFDKFNKKRKEFFELSKKYSFNSTTLLLNEEKFDVCLLTTFYSKNYGAILVAYAVNRIIKDLGYTCLMLQKLKTQWKNFSIKNTIPMEFAKKHYFISKSYYDENELIELNEKCKNFVVGSDQMFSYALRLDFAFLGWVKNNKNKIAFSTSFGHDKFISDEEDIIEKQYLLRRFNHLSLREASENLCKNIFKIKPIELIDPTLMLDKKVYEDLSENVVLKTPKNYLLTYILDLNEEKIQAVKYISKKLNLKIINIQNLDFDYALSNELEFIKNYTPEEFLYLYGHSSFVFTDSYHGTCFAVKFNKPFISMINKKRGKIRYKMFNEMKIKNRFISSFDELKENEKIIDLNLDFSYANKIIENKAKEAINWLICSLKDSKTKRPADFETYFDTKIKNLNYKIFTLEQELNKAQSFKKILKFVFSIENIKRENAKHKVITILGIKFKKKI